LNQSLRKDVVKKVEERKAKENKEVRKKSRRRRPFFLTDNPLF
jgi:hypothetical protein